MSGFRVGRMMIDAAVTIDSDGKIAIIEEELIVTQGDLRDEVKVGSLVKFCNLHRSRPACFVWERVGHVVDVGADRFVVKVYPQGELLENIYHHHARLITARDYALAKFAVGTPVVFDNSQRFDETDVVGTAGARAWDDFKRSQVGNVFTVHQIFQDGDVLVGRSPTVSGVLCSPDYLRKATDKEIMASARDLLSVGDAVVCYEKHDRDIGAPIWISAMYDTVGCVGTVCRVDGDGIYGVRYAHTTFDYKDTWLIKLSAEKAAALRALTDGASQMTAAGFDSRAMTRVLQRWIPKTPAATRIVAEGATGTQASVTPAESVLRKRAAREAIATRNLPADEN